MEGGVELMDLWRKLEDELRWANEGGSDFRRTSQKDK
jgi:hypothetical protein